MFHGIDFIKDLFYEFINRNYGMNKNVFFILVLSCIALYNNPEESLVGHQLIKQKEEKVKKNNQEIEKQKRSLVVYEPTGSQYIQKKKKIKKLEDENKMLKDEISSLKNFKQPSQNDQNQITDYQVQEAENKLYANRREGYNYEDSNEPVFLSGTQQPTIAGTQQPTGGKLSSYEVNKREAEKSYARLRDLRNKRKLNEFQRQELEQLEKEWEHMDQEFFEEKYRKSSSRLSFDKKTALYVAGALGLSSVFYGGYRWYKNKKQKQQERLARLKKRKQNCKSISYQL